MASEAREPPEGRIGRALAVLSVSPLLAYALLATVRIYLLSPVPAPDPYVGTSAGLVVASLCAAFVERWRRATPAQA